MTANNDSNDLEALFDSIAADFSPPAPTPVAPKAPAPASAPSSDADSDDLQALFDSVAADAQAATTKGAAAESDSSGDAWPQQEVVFNRIGHMARALHDTLGQLGYDKVLEKTVSVLPDAKDRLAYVANLTEQAACRVLNATDIASPLVDDIENRSRALGTGWDKVFANQMSPESFKQLATETRAFLNEQLPQKTQATHAQLTEIMMAQDFQDLTDEVNSLMNGPVVNAEGRTDVVVNQEQVDDLLDSLGF